MTKTSSLVQEHPAEGPPDKKAAGQQNLSAKANSAITSRPASAGYSGRALKQESGQSPIIGKGRAFSAVSVTVPVGEPILRAPETHQLAQDKLKFCLTTIHERNSKGASVNVNGHPGWGGDP